MELEFSWQTFEKKWAYSDIKFHVNPSNGSRAVLRGRIDMMKNEWRRYPAIFPSLFIIRSFQLRVWAAIHVVTISRDVWGTIFAVFNLAIQSLVCLSRCWRQVVRGKASDFTFDELHAFHQWGVCILFAYYETPTIALCFVLKALNNQTVEGLSHFQGRTPKVHIYLRLCRGEH